MTRPKPSEPRLPIQPLSEHLSVLVKSGYVIDEIAAKIGVSMRTLHRWLARDTIGLFTADLICTRLRINPTNLWSDWETKGLKE